MCRIDEIGIQINKDMRQWIIFYLYLLLCKNWLRNHYEQQFYNKYRNSISPMLNFMPCYVSSTQLKWPSLKLLLRNYSPWRSIFVTKLNNLPPMLILCIRCLIVKLRFSLGKSMIILAVQTIFNNNSRSVELGSKSLNRKPGMLSQNIALPWHKINT